MIHSKPVSAVRFTSIASACALAFGATLYGCGGGGGGGDDDGNTPTPPVVLPGSATVFYGNPATLTISGGRSPYRVFSNNTAVIPLTNVSTTQSFLVDPNNVDTDTTVTIEVLDNIGQTADATVTVKPAPLNNSFKVTPDPATPGVGCGTAVCSGQTALVEVKLTTVTGAPIAGRSVRFQNVSASGVVNGGGDYFFVDQLGNPTPVSSETTATTDVNGSTFARIKATTNAPTQYALIKMSDLTTGTFVNGNFTIAQYTDGSGTLTVYPETSSITDYYKDGVCAIGAKTDFRIFGGTPPYAIYTAFPQGLLIQNAPVQSNGGAFTAVTNGGWCFEDPGATITITDATGRTITAHVINVDGSNEPTSPVETPNLSVTPEPDNSELACGQSRNFLVTSKAGTVVLASGNPRVTVSILGSTITLSRVADDTTIVGENPNASAGPTAGMPHAGDNDYDVVQVYATDGTNTSTWDIVVDDVCPTP